MKITPAQKDKILREYKSYLKLSPKQYQLLDNLDKFEASHFIFLATRAFYLKSQLRYDMMRGIAEILKITITISDKK